jgi:hypothetical protein
VGEGRVLAWLPAGNRSCMMAVAACSGGEGGFNVNQFTAGATEREREMNTASTDRQTDRRSNREMNNTTRNNRQTKKQMNTDS